MITTAPRFRTLSTRYRRFIEPSADNLPRWQVLIAFPIILMVLGGVLVGLGINGTSSGAYYSSAYSGRDPDLLAGQPRSIRSDEWNTGTSWTISQLQQGLPERNETFPGGMDASLPYDLPRADWSVSFRPHLLGFLFLNEDQAQAWRWWMSGFALMAAVYVFIITVLPRRPVIAAAISIAFFFSPFFQWWYQSTAFWPAVWAAATMGALAWALKTTRRSSRWVWAAIIGYLTAVMAMGIYLPYIIAVGYVVAFLGIGLVTESLRRGLSWGWVLAGVGPIFAGGIAGAAVTVIFLQTRASTVEGFLSTVYPGARLTPTGASGGKSVFRTIGSSFTEALSNSGGFLGANSSEAATFFLIGIFLLPVVAWAIVHQKRGHAVLPWTLIGLVAIAVLLAAYALIPGWDSIAHLLFLDRIPMDSVRTGVIIAFGMDSLALLIYTIAYLDEVDRRPRLAIPIIGAALFLISQIITAVVIARHYGLASLQGQAPYWWFFALMSVAALFHFARRRPAVAVTAFLLATVPASFLVNPVYLGMFDLRQTSVAQNVIRVNAQDPGAWIGIGHPIVTATLVESGVRAYNGVQGSPSPVMWKNIDPGSRYRNQWDRIGFINWTPGIGQPKVTNPSQDAIVVTFDACSQFAQSDVRYVLAEGALNSQCLDLTKRVRTAISFYSIYRVVMP